MTVVDESPHNKYESAGFIRKDLKVNSIFVCKHGNVEIFTIEMPGVMVLCVQPPNDQCVVPALDRINLPHIIIRDFNNHSTTW